MIAYKAYFFKKSLMRTNERAAIFNYFKSVLTLIYFFKLDVYPIIIWTCYF
ncbi:hypothetical protein GGU45_000508 [Niabella hirudinis]